MAGMNLRSIRVDAWWALRKPVHKLTESYSAELVPASLPFNCGTWRPGHGAPRPIPARGPDSTDWIESPSFGGGSVNPVPARTI
jgi:hypothetical protein